LSTLLDDWRQPEQLPRRAPSATSVRAPTTSTAVSTNACAQPLCLPWTLGVEVMVPFCCWCTLAAICRAWARTSSSRATWPMLSLRVVVTIAATAWQPTIPLRNGLLRVCRDWTEMGALRMMLNAHTKPQHSTGLERTDSGSMRTIIHEQLS